MSIFSAAAASLTSKAKPAKTNYIDKNEQDQVDDLAIVRQKQTLYDVSNWVSNT